MIVRNMAALFACRNGSHLGRFAVVAVFLLSFLASGAWGACTAIGGEWSSYVGTTSCYDNYPSTHKCYSGNVNKMSTDNPWYQNGGCTGNSNNYCIAVSSSFLRCVGSRQECNYSGYKCSNECEADSLQCITSSGIWINTGAGTCGGKSCLNCTDERIACESNGGTWVVDVSVPCGYSCSYCDAQCQCEESGGTWETSNGGYCVPVCQSQFCCDSLNQNLPVQADTTWEGCVATDPSNDRCVVLPTVENNTGSTTAECTAKSRYRICTASYVWNRTAGQCAPISTNNCINMDVSDSRCTNVICEAFQSRSVSALQYNGSTECYEGMMLVQDMMVCDNGIREERGRSSELFQVCDSYLEANNISIQDYLSGVNGGTAVIGGNSAGTGGGSGGGNDESAGCVGNGCGTGVFNGGTSVNAQGDTVQNSASPYLGNVWTPQQQYVTSYDSSTGTTTIVQNSQGGDSVVTTVKPTGIRCLGVSGGVATLTNGYSTWTCAGVMSCSQAVLSASLNGGACSASSNGVFNDGYNSDKMPLILDENGNAILTSESDNLERAMEQLARIMNGIAHKDTLNRQKVHQLDRNQQDSLWKATFGNNLDAVRNMQDYIASASSANSEAIAQASSANSQAIGSAASDVAGAVGNVKNAVNSASSANSQAIASATSQITSANSQGFGSVASAVGDASTSLGGKIDNLKNTYRDSVHASNGFLNGILNALDTGGIVNRDLNGIRDAVTGLPAQVGDVYAVSLDNWYNDKLKLTLDENAQKVADAIDSLHLEVKLDSVKIDIPKDSTVDSIYGQLKGKHTFDPNFMNDTLDASGIMQKAYDSTQIDTSYNKDSSFSEHMKAVAGQTTLGESTYADSMVQVMQSKLDSNRQAMNARSDSAVKDYQDSVNKYSGVDSVGRALNNFFSGYSSDCPRECLNITLNHSLMTKGENTTIPLAYYICDLQVIGNYTVIDFLKMILRIITAWYCMSLMLQFMTVKHGTKAKK